MPSPYQYHTADVRAGDRAANTGAAHIDCSNAVVFVLCAL